jgi:formiminoglutamase
MKLPLLISVPHGGLCVPDEIRDYCVLTPEDIRQDRDDGAMEIYAIEEHVESFLTAEVARAIVDLNRPEGDRHADGVVKTHTCRDVQVYNPFPPERVIDLVLDHYYRPYHQGLTALARGGVRLAIDCHTMLAVGPRIGPMAGQERPRICLGNVDGKTCPDEWFEALAYSLEKSFETPVSRNAPFKGGYITQFHGEEMPWVQVEISRAPFLSLEEKRSRFVAALNSFCRTMRL